MDIVRKVAAACACLVVVVYVALVILNISIGYRECRAVAIHNDLNSAGPCATAHAIRG